MRIWHLFYEISLMMNILTLKITKMYLSSPNKPKTITLLVKNPHQKIFWEERWKWQTVKMSSILLFFLQWLSKSSTCWNKLIIGNYSLSISPGRIHISIRNNKICGKMEAVRYWNWRFSSKFPFLCKKSGIP